MNKLYTFSLLLIATVTFSGCSKDVFKPYEDRIEGSWELTGVTRIGYGNSNLDFTGGLFTFYNNGQVEYQDGYGGFYEGNWDIRHRNIPDCYIDEYGNSQCDKRYVRTLQINSADYDTHDTRSEYFDEMVFVSSNRFRAFIYEPQRTYVFEFRRR